MIIQSTILSVCNETTAIIPVSHIRIIIIHFTIVSIAIHAINAIAIERKQYSCVILVCIDILIVIDIPSKRITNYLMQRNALGIMLIIASWLISMMGDTHARIKTSLICSAFEIMRSVIVILRIDIVESVHFLLKINLILGSLILMLILIMRITLRSQTMQAIIGIVNVLLIILTP